jgi:hypothetical protein
MIDFGATYSSPNYQVRDVDGNLAAAGTVTVTLTLPDATTTSPSVTNPSTGIYVFDYLTTQAGRYLVVVSATGGVLGPIVRRWVDAFVVRPVNPASLVSLADAKAHLGEQSSLQDEEIRGYLEVATEIVENIAGPCSVRAFTERVRTGADQLLLSRMPVVAVTSVTSVRDSSVTWASAGLDVDTSAGIVSPAAGGYFTNGPWNVAYTAGRTSVSARHTQAVLEQLWHMWATQRGQQTDSTTPDLLDVAEFESRSPFGLGFLVPRRVMELLESDHMPGFA